MAELPISPAMHSLSDASGVPFDEEADLIVVGTGAGGLTAAITAADNHAKVVIIEKSAYFGGTSATSGGVIWIPASHLAEQAGVQDSAAEAEEYIGALAGGVDPRRIAAFVREAPQMLAYLDRETEVSYASIPYTDYHAELPGGKLGWRSHDPQPFDGRRLGGDLDRLRPTHPTGMLFGRISWNAGEAATLITRAPGWRRALANAMWRYVSDARQRLRSSRSRYLTSGNALLARLKVSLDRRNVAIRYETALVSLIEEQGAVVGAVVRDRGGERRIGARRGVVLAAGGFERDPAMRAQNLTGSPDPTWSGSQHGNTGDAIRAAQQVGAKVERMDAAWWAPTISVPGEACARPLFFERSLPGSIMVDASGRRFTNEAASYHKVGEAMVQAGKTHAWVIFDRLFRWKYPMGPMMPMIPDALHSRGAKSILRKAGTIAGLAKSIGVDPAVLEQTVSRFNEYAARGQDPDFGRGQQAYDRYYGDATVKPNPNLRPLSRAPFYALPINPGDIGTSGGLATDDRARVLDGQDRPIVGLYAIGNTSASVMGRSYPGAGSTIGPAMTFGYVAARDAMRVN